jgi:ribosomal protein L7Ae-like RNA K-turn-binding protein
VSKRQFTRSFKSEVSAGSSQELLERVITGLEERVAGYLSLANKAGKVVSGSDMVLESLRRGAPGLLLLAVDISPDSADRFRAVAAKSAVPVYTMFTKDRLGSLLGKEMRSAVAIVKSGFVDQLTKDLERFGNFFEGGAE